MGFFTVVRLSESAAGDDEGKSDHKNRVWSSEPEIRSSGVVLRMLSNRVLAAAWAKDLSEMDYGSNQRQLTFFFVPRFFAYMVERTSTKDKVGVQGKSCNPVCVVFERHKGSSLFGIPYPHCPITASSVEHPFRASRTSPFHDVDTSGVAAE